MKNDRDFYGPVVLCKYVPDCAPDQAIPLMERYADITGVSGDAYIIEWRGNLHLFSRDTGKCIESYLGEMRDYSIAKWEMERFPAVVTADRTASPPQSLSLS